MDEYDVNKKYKFVEGQVPRYDYKDLMGLKLVENQQPVILTGADLVSTAHKWDLDYLNEHIESKVSVLSHRLNVDGQVSSEVHDNYSISDCEHSFSPVVDIDANNLEKHTCRPAKKPKNSASKINVFKYFDDKKVQGLQDKSSFEQDVVREQLTFQEFLARFNGDRSKERVYLQQPLNGGIGKQIAKDFVGFNWAWAMQRQKDWDWGPLTSNLILIGQKGNVTPCHFDEQQNLFCQLKGSKRFLLFSPENFPCLYPYPVHHPHDRQSQVDLDDPDYAKYPKLKDLKGVEAFVKPGDILYIPMYWWHQVVNVEDTIAINFWHKVTPQDKVGFPLNSCQKVAIVRNIEKMLLEALKDQSELKTLLRWLVDGRY